MGVDRLTCEQRLSEEESPTIVFIRTCGGIPGVAAQRRQLGMPHGKIGMPQMYPNSNTVAKNCFTFSWEIKELQHIISLNLEGLSGFN